MSRRLKVLAGIMGAILGIAALFVAMATLGLLTGFIFE